MLRTVTQTIIHYRGPEILEKYYLTNEYPYPLLSISIFRIVYLQIRDGYLQYGSPISFVYVAVAFLVLDSFVDCSVSSTKAVSTPRRGGLPLPSSYQQTATLSQGCEYGAFTNTLAYYGVERFGPA